MHGASMVHIPIIYNGSLRWAISGFVATELGTEGQFMILLMTWDTSRKIYPHHNVMSFRRTRRKTTRTPSGNGEVIQEKEPLLVQSS
jgi:hypothetical protein